MLSIEKLSVAYGDSRVLWDVDFKVEAKEVVALVGANGAGKTTLLKTIAGLLKPSEGRLIYEGEDVSALPAERRLARGIALVPEGRRLFAGMTVAQNLSVGAYLRRDNAGVQSDMRRVFDYFPRLGEMRSRVAGHLSGGEQQMCAIGRALMARPRLLLVDEMSLGLAPVIVDRLAEVLLEINRSFNVAVVVVEQDVELALEMSTRAYVLETGRMVLQGESTQMLDNDAIQKAFLGHVV